jgi:hypothetical protein
VKSSSDGSERQRSRSRGKKSKRSEKSPKKVENVNDAIEKEIK